MIGWFRRRRQERDQRLLAAVAAEPHGAYGLGLMHTLGFGAGSIYPALVRLEQAGLITSRWEDDPGDRPRRRLYFANRKSIDK